MTLLWRLASAFEVQPGEGKPLSLLLACSFLLGLARLLIITSSIALFLSQFEAAYLPYVYIAVAGALPLTGFIYDWIERRVTVTGLFAGTTVVLALTLCAFRLLHWLFGGQLVAAALVVWAWAVWVLLGIVFWGVAGRLFDLRQAKRLIGLTGSGEVAATMLGGLALPPLSALMGTADLLLMAAGYLWLWLILLLAIFRSYGHRFATAPSLFQKARRHVEKPLPHPLKDRYVALIFGNAAIATLVYYLVDVAFFSQAQIQYRSAEALAGFLGLFSAVLSAVTLMVRTVGTSRLISRYGLQVSFLLLPAGAAASIAAIMLAGTVLNAFSIMFVLLVAARLVLNVLWDSTHKPTELVLYQPLAARQRLRAQTVVEGVGEPLGTGIAGVVMLSFGLFFPVDAVHLAYLAAPILIVWFATTRMPPRAYLSVLSRALGWRVFEVESGQLADPSSIAVLRRSLTGKHVGEAIYSLAMLEQLEPKSFPDYLRAQLSHPSSDMRCYVLGCIERLRLSTLLPDVRQLAAADSAVEVRAAAIRTLSGLAEADALEWVTPFLEDPDPRLRASAMIGMLRSGGIEGILRSGSILMSLAASPSPGERRLAAQLVGEVGVGSFYHPLKALLIDDAMEVRRAALSAAGALRNEALWPLVARNLSVPAVRDAAVAALADGRETVLPLIAEALEKKEVDRDTRVALLKSSGKIGGPKAVRLLLRHAQLADEVLRHQAISSLSECGWRPLETEAPLVRDWIRHDATEVAHCTAALLDLEGFDEAPLLQAALQQKIEQLRERIFLLLSFLYRPELILRARRSLNMPSAESRGYGLEVVDSVVAHELKRMVLPILADVDLEERTRSLGEGLATPPTRLPSVERLRQVAGCTEGWVTPWMQTCALYAAGRLVLVELRDAAQEALASTDRVVRETAAWTTARLDGRCGQQLA